MTSLKNIIELGKNINVVEKLCGNNPKCASLFYSAFRNRLEYQGFNLIDNDITYFERAEKHGKVQDFAVDNFKSAVKYIGGINLVKNPLSKHVKNCDVIIYWGGAMTCLRKWSKDKEQKYKDIVAEEYAKGNTDFIKVHKIIKKRTRLEIPSAGKYHLPKDKLEEIILDDISCLPERGMIITNTHYDSNRIREIMKDLKPESYILDDSGIGMKEYEKGITVWR